MQRWEEMAELSGSSIAETESNITSTVCWLSDLGLWRKFDLPRFRLRLMTETPK